MARLGSRELAEDATSQAFLNALASIDRFTGGSLAAWLFTIARNCSTDLLRARSQPVSADALVAVPEPAAGPEESAIAADEMARLQKAMNMLSAEQRAAIELQLAGWSLAESADAIGKTVPAVKMLRARGILRLRNELSPDTDSGVH